MSLTIYFAVDLMKLTKCSNLAPGINKDYPSVSNYNSFDFFIPNLTTRFIKKKLQTKSNLSHS